jgi:hypothetical protein
MFSGLRYLITQFIALSLLLTPIAQANSETTMKEVLALYKTQDLFKDLKEHQESTPLEKDLIHFIKAEGLTEQKLMPAELDGRGLILKGVHTAKITILPNGRDIEIKINRQTVTVNATSTFQDLITKISPLLETKKYSFVNLFIDEAHASGPTVMIAVVLASVALVVMKAFQIMDTKSFQAANAKLLSLEKKCPEDGQLPRSKSEQEKLRAVIIRATQELKDIQTDGCDKFKIGNFGQLKIERDKVCGETLPRVKACFENVEQAFADVNNSERSIVKDVSPAVKKSKASAAGAAKQ